MTTSSHYFFAIIAATTIAVSAVNADGYEPEIAPLTYAQDQQE